MTWIPLDEGFPNHPKAARAGDLAAWLYVCGLCYAGQHLTDGAVPKNQVAKLTGLPKPTQLAKKLVEVGLWEDPGGDDYLIHDYHEWNKPADDVKRKRESDRQRKQSWRKSPGRDVGHPPDIPPDGPPEIHSDSTRIPSGFPRSPTQSQTEELSSLNNSRLGPVDAAERSEASPQNRRSETPTEAALSLLAERDLAEFESKGGEVKNRRAWMASAVRNRRERHGDELSVIVAEHPEWPAEQVAAVLDPPRQSANGGSKGDPGERSAAAQRAIAERNEARLRGESACGKCSDSGVFERDDGSVERCDCTASPASARASV